MTIDHLSNVILAVGTLGVASFALVDVTKAFGGGISNRGFGFVRKLIGQLFAGATHLPVNQVTEPMGGILLTLRANWLNGTASLSDQKSLAKTLIKLRLSADTAKQLAHKTGVDPKVLASIANKYANGEPLSQEEQNVAGRFDLQLSALIDETYQRADQSYRNSSKALAVLMSLLLALAGRYVLADASISMGAAILAGLLAAPLAPISKDLASALQASAKALQAMRK